MRQQLDSSSAIQQGIHEAEAQDRNAAANRYCETAFVLEGDEEDERAWKKKAQRQLDQDISAIRAKYILLSTEFPHAI